VIAQETDVVMATILGAKSAKLADPIFIRRVGISICASAAAMIRLRRT